MSSEIILSLPEVIAARERIRPYIRQTPIAPLPWLTNAINTNLRLKLENLQVAGSFKSRAAFNNLLLLTEEQRKRGVITASGGNHGLSLTYAASKLGISATIVLPKTATADRVQRIRDLGGTIIPHGTTPTEAYAYAVEQQQRLGKTFIHGFEGERTWQGIGTLALELLEDLPEMDCLLVAIGGGGLISGLATVIKHLRPATRILGVEPTGAAGMYLSIQAGTHTPVTSVRTIADTLAVRSVSETALQITKAHVESISLVTDEQIIEAMKFLWREYNQLVEPAGAAVLAAIQSGAVSLEGSRCPVALICGGNAPGGVSFEYFSKRIKKLANG